MYKEVEGNLITMAQSGSFDVIAHGCNSFCTQRSGLAPQMVTAFQTDKFPMEDYIYKGDINKLGQIDFQNLYQDWGKWHLGGCDVDTVFGDNVSHIIVVNAYTQYHYGAQLKPFDYEAFTLCMRKINHTFKGMHIGLPQIGAGLAGGTWSVIKSIIQKELKDCQVTVVIYKP